MNAYKVSLCVVCFLLMSCSQNTVSCQERVETFNISASVMEGERISEYDYKGNEIHTIEISTVLTPLSRTMAEYGPHYRDQITRNPAWKLVREASTANRYDSAWMVHGVCGNSTAHFSLSKDTEGSYTMETIIQRQPLQ